ncbi:MAG: NAD(P)H-binding protein [Archangiaceae bacterium]|nr:NAD(P)H-binding protein [Archangiaceae bacterium]
MARRALVAGATGALGSKVAQQLEARGWQVRRLTRSRAKAGASGEVHQGDALDPASLEGAAEGCELVFSALGASVAMDLSGWSGFTSLDVRANSNLIAEAQAAKVKRFVYVSVAHDEAVGKTAYVRAHEQVVERLKVSGLDWVVVRPTGFFSALGALFDLAKKGPLPSLGDGQAKSNPIDDDELALVCAAACEGTEREVACGGPEVLTRDQMAQAAFEALGQPVKLRKAPLVMARVAAVLMRPFHPRMAQMVQFIASLSEHDVVAPVRGSKRLVDYFRERAAAAKR